MKTNLNGNKNINNFKSDFKIIALAKNNLIMFRENYLTMQGMNQRLLKNKNSH